MIDRNRYLPAPGTVLGLLVLASLAGCMELLVESAPPSPADLSLALVAAPSASGSASGSVAASAAAAFSSADRIHVGLRRGDEVLVDLRRDFNGAGAETRVRVQVDVDGSQETLDLQVTLLSQEAPVFTARRSVAMAAGETTEAEVSLEPVAAGVRVPQGPITLVSLGEQATLDGAVLFATGDPIPGLHVEWSTTDTHVISVTPAGVVTAEAAGDARVTGSYQGLSAAVDIQVRQAVASITIDPGTVQLRPGDAFFLSASLYDAGGHPLPAGARGLTWISSDPGVATVSSVPDGPSDDVVVEGIAEGSVTITASADGVSGTAHVDVLGVLIESVEVSPSAVRVRVDSTAQLTATARDGDGQVVSGTMFEWASSDPGVAEVDANGVVTGRAAGDVTITATADGVSGTASVTVEPERGDPGDFTGQWLGTWVADDDPSNHGGVELHLEQDGSSADGIMWLSESGEVYAVVEFVAQVDGSDLSFLLDDGEGFTTFTSLTLAEDGASMSGSAVDCFEEHCFHYTLHLDRTSGTRAAFDAAASRDAAAEVGPPPSRPAPLAPRHP